MARKDKRKGPPQPEEVIDLTARIGKRDAPAPAPPPKPVAPPSRHDAAIPAKPRQRPTEPPRVDARGRPLLIGMGEAPGPPVPESETTPVHAVGASGESREQVSLIEKALAEDAAAERTPAIPSPRTRPAPGEVDLVATPLPTPDDWHRFELALRKVRGVGQLRTEYYRHGVLKVRVQYTGRERFAAALRTGVPGYRVRVIGEDRSTVQVLLSAENEERRPG